MLADFVDLLGGPPLFERVGERRWNLHLPSGILLMLPEGRPFAALDWLRRSGLPSQLSGDRLAALDLRNPERIFLRKRAAEATGDRRNGAT